MEVINDMPGVCEHCRKEKSGDTLCDFCNKSMCWACCKWHDRSNECPRLYRTFSLEERVRWKVLDSTLKNERGPEVWTIVFNAPDDGRLWEIKLQSTYPYTQIGEATLVKPIQIITTDYVPVMSKHTSRCNNCGTSFSEDELCGVLLCNECNS